MSPLVAQSNDDGTGIRSLELGKSIKRELAGGESHSYRVLLTPGQYFHAIVDQEGIDVVVLLFDPENQLLFEVNNQAGTSGSEGLLLIADKLGSYRLEIRARDNNGPTGHYEVKVKALRKASERDQRYLAASQAFSQAELLRAKGTEGSLREALQKYQDSLGLYRTVRSRRAEATALLNIGATYEILGEKRSALSSYTRALPLLPAIADPFTEATTLNSIGGLHDELGQKRSAFGFYARALRRWRQIKDIRGEATTLNNIGKVHYDLDQNRQALAQFRLALRLYHAADDHRGEALTLNNMGEVYISTGATLAALNSLRRALTLYHAIQDLGGEAMCLANIGGVHGKLGMPQEALNHYRQALALFKAVEDRNGEATSFNNIGRVQHESGDIQQALDSFEGALKIYRDIEDPEGEATTLLNIGGIYTDLAEFEQALNSFTQALAIWRSIEARRGSAAALAGIGAVYDATGRKQQALNYFREALQIYSAVKDTRASASMFNNIGGVWDDLGRKDKALFYIQKALRLYRSVEDRSGQATAMNYIGKIYDDLGRKNEALYNYSQALELRRAVNDRSGEAITLANIAFFKRESSAFQEALTRIESALSIFESLRLKIGSQELRASYFSTVQDSYEFYVDLLMQLHRQGQPDGYDRKALQVSERARARSLIELLMEASVEIRQGVDSRLIERERVLNQELNRVARDDMSFRGGNQAFDRNIKDIITEYWQVRAKIRETSPRYAELSQPHLFTIEELQKTLDADSLLLEYSLGKDHSYLWAVTANAIASYVLPGRAQIEAAAKEFHSHLTSPEDGTEIRDEEVSEAASRLSRLILEPVTSQLGQKRLVIVADGALQYVPFAALLEPIQGSKGKQPLIINHEIVSLPSMAVVMSLRKETKGRKSPPKDLIMLADPVFSSDDARLKPISAVEDNEERKKPYQQTIEPIQTLFNRLPGTRREAFEIMGLLSPNKARLALDFDANRNLAIGGELSQYRYVHFATHGLIDIAHPELTAIVLSLVDANGNWQDGFLRAHDVYNLNLQADLVVLSACRTALGREIRGEGLISLTRGFMYAGTPRVVASLWRVDDDSPAELMRVFYMGVLKEGKRPAEALRVAQLEMLKTGHWRAPHYWAAFVFQGDWQ